MPHALSFLASPTVYIYINCMIICDYIILPTAMSGIVRCPWKGVTC